MVFFTQIFPKLFAVLKIPQKNTTIFAVKKFQKKFLWRGEAVQEVLDFIVTKKLGMAQELP